MTRFLLVAGVLKECVTALLVTVLAILCPFIMWVLS